MDLTIIKTASGLFAAYGEDSQAAVASVKTGQLLQGKFTRMRNYEAHKRYFVLLDLLWDIWSEQVPTEQYKGQDILPERTRFRKDVAIMAGFYTPVWNIKNELRLEAKSISFGSMDQQEFEALYSATLNVGLQKILKPGAMTEEQLRARVEEILRFDT